jgi:DNA mismatch endonuclease, patch repair protein
MADIFSKAKRSEVMARIRSRGNKGTEGAMVAVLRGAGITGWRRQIEIKTGTSNVQRPTSNIERGRKRGMKRGEKLVRPFRVRPDFVWRRERVALFVDGCFWHGCRWHGTKPASNKAFWREKLAKNRARDRLVTRTLRKAGWRVVRVWEHTLPRAAREARVREKLVGKIRGNIERPTSNVQHRKVGS